MGVCQTGFRKVHVREDPECRLHGIAERMNVRVPQPQPVPQPLPAPTVAGGGMQPHPCNCLQLQQQRREMQTHPLTTRPSSSPGGDSTYSTNRQPKTNGSPDRSQLANREAPRTLKRGSREDEASYELYQQRLSERYRVGEQVDRFVQIVDRYMPRIADENRAYVMRYPHKVGEILQKAWKLRKKRQKAKTSDALERKAVQKNLWR